jgi:hypothetical protein
MLPIYLVGITGGDRIPIACRTLRWWCFCDRVAGGAYRVSGASGASEGFCICDECLRLMRRWSDKCKTLTLIAITRSPFRSSLSRYRYRDRHLSISRSPIRLSSLHRCLLTFSFFLFPSLSVGCRTSRGLRRWGWDWWRDNRAATRNPSQLDRQKLNSKVSQWCHHLWRRSLVLSPLCSFAFGSCVIYLPKS